MTACHNSGMNWFGDPRTWPADDLIGWSPGMGMAMVGAGYREGVFPMPIDKHDDRVVGWFSPQLRGILPLAGLRVSTSLRKSAKRYTTTVNRDFPGVIARCADPARPLGWIDEEVREIYTALHRAGIAVSVETWNGRDELVGGLYGVSLGGLFAGESMFFDPDLGRDASKVALLRLVHELSRDGQDRLLDVQWRTAHLASLGVVEISRGQYLRRLAAALPLPEPAWARCGRLPGNI